MPPISVGCFERRQKVVPTLWMYKELKELSCMSSRWLAGLKARAQSDLQGHVLCP